MAKGDQQDCVSRLAAVLPAHWFPDGGDPSPVVTAVVNGLAWGWAQIYSLLVYVRAQSRILTATDVWLDLAAQDFFGRGLTRRPSEADASLRNRIIMRMFRPACTPGAIIEALLILTGRVAVITEAGQPPYTFLITAYRPNAGGTMSTQGYSTQPQMVGGWGVGAIQWVSPNMNPGQVVDAEITQTIMDLKPEGTIAVITISN